MRTRYFHEPIIPRRARKFVCKHRRNTRHRNSVLKLKVAANCTVYDVRLQIIEACSQEVIGDCEHGGGRAHWEFLESLGVYIGMDLEKYSQCQAITLHANVLEYLEWPDSNNTST